MTFPIFLVLQRNNDDGSDDGSDEGDDVDDENYLPGYC